ncbi:cyclin-G2 [Biomphalaria pfeifferi]|uniref:Cyclin-G2 n=1 Tax=Biomphalaria pfeifferi TaxID=112525 RepID=A0AAD8FII4_BIOPF|nr:cyclin-G2 [Biomphalaria pfeifferi]
MCFPKNERMALTQSVAEKLQCMAQRQKCFINKQNLKELSKDEFEQYMNIRTACFHFIKLPHNHFHTGSDTFAAAINILDVFLWKVKVTERHLTIVAVACFLISSKMFEPEELCPSAKDLSRNFEWTTKDLCRMERHILSKFGWCSSTVSYLDFVSLFADIYGMSTDATSHKITELAQQCLAKQSTVLLEPAVLALSLIHHFKTENCTSPSEQQLLVYCNIQEQSLKECCESLSTIAASSPFCASKVKPKLPQRRFDKPSEMGITCLSTIEEDMSA